MGCFCAKKRRKIHVQNHTDDNILTTNSILTNSKVVLHNNYIRDCKSCKILGKKVCDGSCGGVSCRGSYSRSRSSSNSFGTWYNDKIIPTYDIQSKISYDVSPVRLFAKGSSLLSNTSNTSDTSNTSGLLLNSRSNSWKARLSLEQSLDEKVKRAIYEKTIYNTDPLPIRNVIKANKCKKLCSFSSMYKKKHSGSIKHMAKQRSEKWLTIPKRQTC